MNKEHEPIKKEEIDNLVLDEYTEDEKEEILSVINEYNSICLEILNCKN